MRSQNPLFAQCFPRGLPDDCPIDCHVPPFLPRSIDFHWGKFNLPTTYPGGSVGIPCFVVSMLNWLLFLPLLWVVLQLLVLYLQTQRFLQVRFRYPRYEVQSLRELPSDLKQVFQHPIAQLKDLGFRLCGAYRIQKIFHFEQADDRAVLLYHPQTQTYAELEIRFPADGQDLTSVSFYQVFQDQTWLLTMNGLAHGIVDALPETIVSDPYCASLEAQWQHHQRKLSALPKLTWGLKPGQFLTALQKQQQRYIDQLLARKLLIIRREGWFLTFRAAWQLAWKQRRHMSQVSKRQSRLQRLIRQQPELRQEVPVSLQIQTFQRLRALETNHRDLGLGKWIFLGTLGLFVLVAIALPQLTGTFSTRDLVTIVAVLLLHEVGHFGAMKWFGYRDTKMFFLPMFGAAVTGRKDDASLTEKIWVLLAGPLPGLVLGLGLLGVGHGRSLPDWVDHAAWMLIVLNVVNLLPIYPLDGGKIANHLLFSRYPWTDIIFKAMTVSLFGILGFFSPTLFLLALATAASIPTSYRTAKLNLTIQQQLGQVPPHHDVLPLIFQQMRSAGYAHLPVAKRDAIAKELLQRQQEDRAPWLSRMALAAFYGMSLLVGLGGTVVASLPRAQEFFAQRPVEQLGDASAMTAQLKRLDQRIDQNPQNPDLYRQRAELYQRLFGLEAARNFDSANLTVDENQGFDPTHLGYSYLEKALADYDRLIALSPKPLEIQQRRVHLLMLMGRSQQAVAAYTAMIQQQPDRWQFYLGRAQIYYTLGQYPATIADATALLQRKPDFPYAYELRAKAKHAIADQAGARADQAAAQKLLQTVATTRD